MSEVAQNPASPKVAMSPSGDSKDVEPVERKPKKMILDEKNENLGIIRGIKGTVKWFSLFKHFGFVARMDNGEEIFVHASSIVQSGRIQRGLNAEQEVEMDVSVGPKGLQAIAVTSPGGYPIEDTEPLILRYNRSRRPIKKDEAVPEGKGQPKPRGRRNNKKATQEQKSKDTKPKDNGDGQQP